MSDYFEESIARHRGHAGRAEDDRLVLAIRDYRGQYKSDSDPYRDLFTVMRVYEDEAQSRGLVVPGGAYAPMGNPKKRAVQKSAKAGDLRRTMAAREKKLKELERRAIEAIVPLEAAVELEANPVRALSASGQVGLTRGQVARKGAVGAGRRGRVAKELRGKRTERALRALGNPESPEEYVSAARILMSHDDRDPGLFEKSYAKWQVGDSPKDLLSAFESATRAEVNYRHAGRETESGFADAQAEGVRREILELGR